MTVHLDKDLPVPLYHQLKTVLLEQLRQGRWKPGDKLPTEDELGAQFRVSKATVRQSLRDLAQAGLVHRQQGRGTFVADTKIQFGPRLLNSFTQEMRDLGRQAGSRVLEQKVVPAGEDIARKLQVPPEAPIFLLRRLRLAEGEPMGLQTVHIPIHFAPGIADLSFDSASLYETLEKRFGLLPDHASQEHFAIALDGSEADLLNVPAGSPALGGERLSFLRGGEPLELTYSIMRGDRYQIQLKLVRAPER